jgi:hypothetical protein
MNAPPVDHLDTASGFEQHIFGLQIAMNGVVLMRHSDNLGDSLSQTNSFRDRKRVAFQSLSQALTLDETHLDVEAMIVNAVVFTNQDPAVARQGSQRRVHPLRLAYETCQRRLVVRADGVTNLQRPSHANGVAHLEYLALAAGSQSAL